MKIAEIRGLAFQQKEKVDDEEKLVKSCNVLDYNKYYKLGLVAYPSTQEVEARGSAQV